jgi:hypothetical protein
LSRGAWIFAGLGLAFAASLMFLMGKALDTKAPIRIDRGGGAPLSLPPAPTVSPAEAAAREVEAMRALVTRRADALARRAAEQAFAGEDAARAQCTFTEATLVHRDEASAYWNAGFSCVDPRQPDSLPNLTSVSVRLVRTNERWTLEN